MEIKKVTVKLAYLVAFLTMVSGMCSAKRMDLRLADSEVYVAILQHLGMKDNLVAVDCLWKDTEETRKGYVDCKRELEALEAATFSSYLNRIFKVSRNIELTPKLKTEADWIDSDLEKYIFERKTYSDQEWSGLMNNNQSYPLTSSHSVRNTRNLQWHIFSQRFPNKLELVYLGPVGYGRSGKQALTKVRMVTQKRTRVRYVLLEKSYTWRVVNTYDPYRY